MHAHGDHGSVFHEGERAVQAATGERAIAERNSRMIQATVPPAPASFLARQRMLVLASVDEAGAPWASLVFGPEGFANTPNGESIVLDRARIEVCSGDALLHDLRVGGPLGILAIDLGSRRRYRINGFVSALHEDRIVLTVREAFGNCQKYIQRRRAHEHRDAARTAAEPIGGSLLDPMRRALVRRADTMFVASRHPVRGADVSHRGGQPGFLEVRDERTIRVPEYAGNGLYNTLGNLLVCGLAGLAIVDFDGGRVLQIAGSTSLVLDVPTSTDKDLAEAGGDSRASATTGRYWDFTVSRWTELSLPRTFRWELLERSPFNPPL